MSHMTILPLTGCATGTEGDGCPLQPVGISYTGSSQLGESTPVEGFTSGLCV